MADKKTVTAADVTYPTGKYTLNGWGQTQADFAFFDVAQDKVELNWVPLSLGFSANTSAFAENPAASGAIAPRFCSGHQRPAYCG